MSEGKPSYKADDLLHLPHSWEANSLEICALGPKPMVWQAGGLNDKTFAHQRGKQVFSSCETEREISPHTVPSPISLPPPFLGRGVGRCCHLQTFIPAFSIYTLWGGEANSKQILQSSRCSGQGGGQQLRGKAPPWACEKPTAKDPSFQRPWHLQLRFLRGR